jgi:subtilisin family serine protease
MRNGKLVKSLLLIFVMLVALAPALAASGAEPEAVVRVWVEFRPGAQAQVQAALQSSGARIHYTFERLNAFVVSLPTAALRGMDRNPNVISIEVDPVRELVKNMPSKTIVETSVLPEQVVPYGVDMVQARDLWDKNRDGKIDRRAVTGAGASVCIIDTGLFTGHEDFQGVDIYGGYSQTNPDPALWTHDGYGHGTHVAGTVTAMNNDYGVVGVSPGAVSLFMVKIFDDDGLWVNKAHASDLVGAANICADNGAQVISMSLSGTQSSRYEERAFDTLYAAGILSVAAASNDGIEVYHYPASYDSVISVAAIDQNYVVADFSQFNDQVELAAPGVGVLSTVPFVAVAEVTVDGETFSGNHIEYAAYGSASGALVDGGRCQTTGSWAGAVVLCERGDISFYDKVMNVQNSGGAAAVIYNNAPGNFLGTLGDGNSSTIVAVSLSQEDGQYLLANKLGKLAAVSSTITWQASGYEAWDGTSMATPHVSAVAALLWSWKPELTNEQIRTALRATAMDLGDPGRDVHYGFGLVQVYDAWVYLGGGKPPKK